MDGIQNKKGLLYKSKLYFKHHAPTILTCLGVIGVVSTAIMAIKATPKAVRLIEAAEVKKSSSLGQGNEGLDGELTPVEIVRTTWKCYIPVVVIGLSTITCILGANILNKRNQASITSAYALLHQSYQRYRNAAKSAYGADADSKIKTKMAKDVYVSADGYSVYSTDLDGGCEKILCCDLYSGQYFTSTMAAILNAEYHINRNLALRGDVTVNEFYEFLGIEKIDCGDKIGWDMDELIAGGIMWLDFGNGYVKMDDGMECCVISTIVEPLMLCDEN